MVMSSPRSLCRLATDPLHELLAEPINRTGISNAWGFRKVIGVPFVKGDPRRHCQGVPPSPKFPALSAPPAVVDW